MRPARQHPDRQRAFEDIFARPTQHAPGRPPAAAAPPPGGFAPAQAYAQYGPPMPVYDQPRPQSTYYGNGAGYPMQMQMPAGPRALQPPGQVVDMRQHPQQHMMYPQQAYNSPYMQQQPLQQPQQPHPAQLAQDYIFQQAAHQQQYQPPSPVDYLSDQGSSRKNSVASGMEQQQQPANDFSRDPHLSAYMVMPSQDDARPVTTSSEDFNSGDNDGATAGSKSSDQGSFQSDGFTQTNPSMNNYFDDGFTSSSASAYSRTYTPQMPHRSSQESDRYSGYAVQAPSGPRPLPTTSQSAFRPYASSSAASQMAQQRPYSVYDGDHSPPMHHHPYMQSHPSLARASTDSFRGTPPIPSPYHPNHHNQQYMYSNVPMPQPQPPPSGERTFSMTSATASMMSRPAASSTVVTHARKSPIVYPALISRVAEAFKMRVVLAEHSKDGLQYTDSFNGREAVDKICYIIKTTDRNLALLLGRALDAQKFFHDVAWEHRLRDSPFEVYQFKARMAFVASDGVHEPALLDRQQSAISMASTVDGVLPSDLSHKMLLQDPQRPGHTTMQDPQAIIQQQAAAAENQLPSGIFTLLTDCYSPTCSKDRLCYSISCPRRLEQQSRLKLKPQPGLKRSDSTVSLGDLKEPGTLWVQKVPQSVVDSIDKGERDRQEAINEIIYTERDFLRDIEYLRDVWIKGIREGTAVPADKKEDLIKQIFWNLLEIHPVSQRLVEALHQRQKASHVVHEIGDILLEHVPNFTPFVGYGSHQIFGKYEFEKEKGKNLAFAAFVEEMERLPESRKLELNGYLTKPTTRLARYPLLLGVVLKKTPEDHPDQIHIPKVIKIVKDLLSTLNADSGRSENRFSLMQLDSQLVFKPGEMVNLKLRDDNRELIFKGALKKRGGTQSESAELQVFLLDNAVVMTKPKNSKTEVYKVFRKPIPLELLIVTYIEENGTASRIGSGRTRALLSRNSSGGRPGFTAPPASAQNSKNGFAMVFTHLGRRGYEITLWAPTWVSRKNWLEKIETRQLELRERSLVFDSALLSEGIFTGANRVTCAAPFDAGQRLVLGTETGVYIADLNARGKLPVKVIAVANVTQVEVLDDHGLLIVLADKAVQTFFVDSLDAKYAQDAARRSRKITSNTSFFKSGVCMGRTLVCVVKSGNSATTIKTLEPVDQSRAAKKQPGLRKFLQGSHEHFKVYKEFYLPIPTDSVHFLKSKLCIGCPKGFEIVDLETLNTQGLLDPADASLDFVQKGENVRPLAIYRIDSEFLLCYDEFAFYVNKNGWRTQGDWRIKWEGRPTHFALHYPFVLAFEPTFIEVRHVVTSALMQIIPGSGLRCLYDDSPVASSASSSHFNHYGSHHQQQNGMLPPHMQQQMARQSMYSTSSGPSMRMPQRPSQILFVDNGHQIYKLLPAPP